MCHTRRPIFMVRPYIHKYISPNTNTQSIFTNTHKYENPSQTYTNTSPFKYIGTYANAQFTCTDVYKYEPWLTDVHKYGHFHGYTQI